MIVFLIFAGIGGISIVLVIGGNALMPLYEKLQTRNECLEHQ
jgi:hypothetical protein